MNADISVMYIKKWCPGAEFDAYPKRQSVTESININSLADHHIWSTIKTLPATLPEPSSMDRGSSDCFQTINVLEQEFVWVLILIVT